MMLKCIYHSCACALVIGLSREKWTGVHFSLKKAVLPSEKLMGCSFISLSCCVGYKSITNDAFITVLYHDREFRLFCDSHHQRDSWPPGPLLVEQKLDRVHFWSTKTGPRLCISLRRQSTFYPGPIIA